MYILQKDNQTFYGPNIWNPKLIESYIEDDFEIEMVVPQIAPTSGTNIGHNIFVYTLSNTDIPKYNPKIETPHGPFYRIENNLAIQYYEIIDKQINFVKSELLQKLAENRWKKEISGTIINVQNIDLKITTQRGERDIFLQAVQNNLDNQTWKLFDTNNQPVWLTLSIADLQLIVSSIINHIQSVFDWEKIIAESINNATTLTDLDSIDIGDIVPNIGE